MGYLYEACDQIWDFCHQQLLRKMWQKVSWTDERTEGQTGNGGINIFCVPHKNNCKTKLVLHDMKQTDSSIIIVRNVCMLTTASVIVYLFFTRSWSAIIGPKLFFTRSWSAIIRTKQPKVNQSPQQWRGW
jgi:hypothetical protein